MEIKELFIYREEHILKDSVDSDGYISESRFIDFCLPCLNETKYVDTTDVNNSFDPLENGSIRVNAYVVNESGERLQLFIVNEESLNPASNIEALMIAQRAYYEKFFSGALTFLKKSIKKQINELLQDGSPSWVLVHQLQNAEYLDQIDTVEIFLLTATASIESRGAAPSVKMLEFEDDSITVNFTNNNQRQSKELIIMKRLIDLNFLYNVQIAQGSRYPLTIDFTSAAFNYPIPFLHAASEDEFDSYLCAVPATLIAELYKRHSSRLLEKNVRSFLQLKGVNKGMQDTIRKEPHKFIAYNNGLTITATSTELIKSNGISYIKSLSDFQIVNGGQTTATLYFSQKAGLPIDAIKIMAKINVAKNASEETLDELISNISNFSNAQSKVSKVDLRARSAQLVSIKTLSESVLTVSGKKWFFERAKGEYATMIRINYSKKAQFEKAFPKERRFTKEELAKYYSSWGDKPYAVKKGGEKIFRFFLEEISGEGKSKKALTINRQFYEDLIARIILFKNLEKIYGSGSSSLGQLRSAVVPYALSSVFTFTTGNKKVDPFDLSKIWKVEKLDDTLQTFFKNLMKLMNRLIKKFSKSDDLGEYSKKPELWDAIKESDELWEFMDDNKSLIKKYTISPEELKKRNNDFTSETVDFELLAYNATIFDRGINFYKKILNSESSKLSPSKTLKLNSIIASIRENITIEENHIEFEKELIRDISIQHPELIDKINSDIFTFTVNFIIKKYNVAISTGKNVQASFEAIKEQAKKKQVKYYSVFGDIGKVLNEEELPSMQQIKEATEYCKTLSIE